MKRTRIKLALIVVSAFALVRPEPVAAEVRLEKLPAMDRVDVISVGVHPWTMTFGNYANQGSPKLIPGGADRVFYASGSTLHLIDTKTGIVLRRWVFSNQIDDVKPAGANFAVHMSRHDADNPLSESATIGLNLPAPDYWVDSLLMYRLASFDGGWLDVDVHFTSNAREGPPAMRYDRKPLTRADAERLLVAVNDAVRRNPFLARLAVDAALLLKDAGHAEADAVFREALTRTDFYGELFWIAQDLDNVGESEWAGLAFDQASASFWKHGSDPRLVSMLLPKLIMGYLPFDARVEKISAKRRSELSERLYRMAPYVQGSSAAWSALATYYGEIGDTNNAALWRARASESAAKTGYLGEFDSDANRELLGIAALVVALLLCQLVLQRRYAPQRRLTQQHGFFAWLRRADPRSWYVFWDRHDRRLQGFILIGLWLMTGLTGATIQTENRANAWPVSGSAGSLRAAVTREYLETLGSTPERDFLLALSLQQSGDFEPAEKLYRTLPYSAEAWNNRGVIQARQHKDEASAESFRHALEIAPGMPEAALNLGQPTMAYWAGVHQQYLPGQKMLAMPSHQMIRSAVRGSRLRLLGPIVMGPFSMVPGIEKAVADHYSNFQIEAPLPFRLLNQFQNIVILGSSFIFAAILLLLLLTPYREVTQTPGRWHCLLELLVPGTFRSGWIWRALVLGFFVYGICGVLDLTIWPPRWTGVGAMVSFRPLGLPASMERALTASPLNQATIWMHGPAILVSLFFMANAVMVFRSLRRNTK